MDPTRTNDDKRRIVTRMLQDPEWGTWSDREIARHCGVSNFIVSKRRKELFPSVRESQIARTVSRGGTVYTMDTSAIGQRDAAPVPLVAAPPADVFVGEGLDDAVRVRVYARENATQRGLSSTALTGAVASAVRYVAKIILTGHAQQLLSNFDIPTLRRRHRCP